MNALVNKIIPFSAVDGPGNRTAIFLQGCNFRCQYCHNPETMQVCLNCGECLKYCPTGAISMVDGKVRYDVSKCCFCDSCFKHCPNNASPRVRSLSAEEVMQEVKKNVPFIRGITVSGGECTRWPEFLKELMVLAKKENLTVLLDSNGTYDFEKDEYGLLENCAGVMLDIKAYKANDHRAVTSQDNTMVLKNLKYLASIGQLEEVRTVIVPDLFDTKETVKDVSETIVPYLNLRSIRYKIICYRPFGVQEKYKNVLRAPTQEELEEHASIARNIGVKDIVII
jgi:pyruvate formate lyase activating enzyme